MRDYANDRKTTKQAVDWAAFRGFFTPSLGGPDSQGLPRNGDLAKAAEASGLRGGTSTTSTSSEDGRDEWFYEISKTCFFVSFWGVFVEFLRCLANFGCFFLEALDVKAFLEGFFELSSGFISKSNSRVVLETELLKEDNLVT